MMRNQLFSAINTIKAVEIGKTAKTAKKVKKAKQQRGMMPCLLTEIKSWLVAITVAFATMLLLAGSSFAVDNTAIKASVKELTDSNSWVQMALGVTGGIVGLVALMTQHPKIGFTILGGTAGGLFLMNKIFLA
jgi:hypothetical protein